jgi:hypothetical protein
VLLIFACLAGTRGPNRFGPEPLGGDDASARTIGQYPSAHAPQPRRDALAETERLAQLRASRSLTEAEFEVMKGPGPLERADGVNDGGFAILVLLLAVGMCVLYVLPTVIAFRRRHPNRWAILVINIALGSTGIRWLGALVWAFNAVHRPDEPGRSHGGESGLNLFVNNPKDVCLVGMPHVAGDAGLSGPPSALAVVQELERLGRLRAESCINQVEFERLKAAVLQRL